MSFGEDMMFIMDFLIVCQKISFINEPLYYYEMAENGLFASYRKSFLHDVLICFERMIEQTKPYQKGKDDLLSLTMKYYNYVYRHMQGIVLHEKKRKKALKETYQNKTVSSIFTRIVQLTNEEMRMLCFDEYEKRIPRLVIEKKIRKAIRRTIYVFDENCLMRRIKSLFKR